MEKPAHGSTIISPDANRMFGRFTTESSTPPSTSGLSVRSPRRLRSILQTEWPSPVSQPGRGALILTLKSANDLSSPRIVKHEQASAHRWHLEVRLQSPDQVDAELITWIRAAIELAGLAPMDTNSRRCIMKLSGTRGKNDRKPACSMTVAAKSPNPDRVLDGIPPDTRVVIADVTWEFYASLVARFATAQAAGSPSMGRTLNL